jgi:excisionase family DNA binding protein
MYSANNPSPFLTLTEASELLKISDRSLRKLIALGEVRAVKLGRRIVRVPITEIDRLLAGCREIRSAGGGGAKNDEKHG